MDITGQEMREVVVTKLRELIDQIEAGHVSLIDVTYSPPQLAAPWHLAPSETLSLTYQRTGEAVE